MAWWRTRERASDAGYGGIPRVGDVNRAVRNELLDPGNGLRPQRSPLVHEDAGRAVTRRGRFAFYTGSVFPRRRWGAEGIADVADVPQRL
jgi:hypothetical protein